MKGFKAAVAVLILSLLSAGAADAWGWRDGGGRGGGRGAFAAPLPAPRFGRGGLPRQPGMVPRGYARPEMRGYPPYADPVPQPARGFRRGEFMPRAIAGGQVLDPRRYRLRSPPPGYVWYGVGRDAYLVQRSTGLILDTAPGAW